MPKAKAVMSFYWGDRLLHTDDVVDLTPEEAPGLTYPGCYFVLIEEPDRMVPEEPIAPIKLEPEPKKGKHSHS